jgi:hypothetical protein
MNTLRQSRLGNVSAVAKRGAAVLQKKQTMDGVVVGSLFHGFSSGDPVIA